ncbi:MAG TPA: hypothetical protein VF026_14555 [Ktedonobacteraceae bacterium]
MVPAAFANFFLASTGAAAALVGLLFVAVSIAPEQTVLEGASLENRARAGSAFTALLNAFFVSLAALIPSSNLGWTALVLSLIGLFNTLLLGWNLLSQRSHWPDMVRRVVILVVSLVLYGFELYYAVQLLRFPGQSNPLFALTSLLLGIYGVGLVRAWELIGVRRYGLLSWLSPLRDDPGRGARKSEMEQPHPDKSTGSREGT